MCRLSIENFLIKIFFFSFFSFFINVKTDALITDNKRTRRIKFLLIFFPWKLSGFPLPAVLFLVCWQRRT